ncbi:hypothetical protein SH601_08290 [Gracilibacillus sp. S3-1-1]|uniref:Uncharacterized protein n=1 Tax=Gracilibacillus pellucidus TaxID=3095368 RepID=A0ACC6M516_9BACI|nr:hypothetical protein [Gracilibacillus sp. S3-1-1]MDX8045986.1 hypothetical protein [Gracilibacillus sp. S3-1-1]
MKISKVFFFLTAITTIIYLFRNNLMKIITTVPLLRKYAVRMTMSIPFVRRKMIGSLFK